MSLLSRFIAKGSNKANVAAPSPTRYGTVTSISGQTVSVMVDGNTEPTPCTTTVRCRAGQRVIVEVRNGIAVVTGNVTSPSPDGATVDDVIEDVNGVKRLVRDTTDGTLTAKVGQPFGSLVDSEGGVYVVALTWDDDEPTIVSSWSTIDEDGFSYINRGVTGEPSFVTDGDNMTVGLGSGTRMLFRRNGFRSALNGLTKVFGIGNGTTTFQDKFSVGMDGGISTAAYDMPATNSTVADIVTAPTPSSPSDATITISSCSAVVWGKLCQLDITWSSDKDIAVSADGNVTNVTVGTIDSGYRPLIEAVGHANGDNLGAEIYRVYAGGTVALSAMEGTGAARTIAANSSHTFRALYIIK